MTPPSVAQLVARFPEFDGAAVDYPELLEAVLLESASETGDLFPNADSQLAYCLTQAAYLLYQSPSAIKLGLSDKNAPKAESLRLLLMRKAQIATMGLRVF